MWLPTFKSTLKKPSACKPSSQPAGRTNFPCPYDFLSRMYPVSSGYRLFQVCSPCSSAFLWRAMQTYPCQSWCGRPRRNPEILVRCPRCLVGGVLLALSNIHHASLQGGSSSPKMVAEALSIHVSVSGFIS